MAYVPLILLLFVQQAAKPQAPVPSVNAIAYNAYEHLHAGRFDKAEKEFDNLSRISSEDAECYRVILDILRSHKDGVYLLTESYPPGAELLGSDKLMLKPGFIILSKPMAMEAALRDSAKLDVRKASGLLNQAAEMTESEPEKARELLVGAEKLMDHADLLSPGITDGYRLELVQSLIQTHRTEAALHAGRFDMLCRDLGALRKKDCDLYSKRLDVLEQHLNKASSHLEQIVPLAAERKKDIPDETARVNKEIVVINAIAKMIRQEKRKLSKE